MKSAEPRTEIEMKEHSLQKTQTSRLRKRKNCHDYKEVEISSEESSGEEWSEEKSKKAYRKPTKNARRYQRPNINSEKNMKQFEESPEKNKDPVINTDAGTIPETTYYRPTSNSMYIPTITAEMIQDDGNNLTVHTTSAEYFKYARARQTTKNDHADPMKVFQIIAAVRKRPIIWDQRLVCNQNTALIRRAWQQLNEELGFDEDYPLTRRKQIWKSKRDYYSHVYNTDSLEKWMFTDALDFYEPMVNFRTTVYLRPTVTSDPVNEMFSSNLHDKLILADKTIQCSSLDKTNVLKFLLKSLFDVGTADIDMMEKHGQKLLEIFEYNQQAIKINTSN